MQGGYEAGSWDGGLRRGYPEVPFEQVRETEAVWEQGREARIGKYSEVGSACGSGSPVCSAVKAAHPRKRPHGKVGA